jgi:hypothetical protein
MIAKDISVQIKKRALVAIGELDSIVSDVRGKCREEEFEAIKRGVGMSIIRIIDDVLEPIYRQHPELDNDREQKNGE